MFDDVFSAAHLRCHLCVVAAAFVQNTNNSVLYPKFLRPKLNRSSRCQCAASKRFDWISVNQISNHSKFWSKIRSNSLLESKISELTMQLPKFVLSCWQKSQGFPFCACECAGLCMLDGCRKAVIFHNTSMFFNFGEWNGDSVFPQIIWGVFELNIDFKSDRQSVPNCPSLADAEHEHEHPRSKKIIHEHS